MKIRTGFVSNSSSSSFVVYKSEIAEHWSEIIGDLYVFRDSEDNEYSEWGDSGNTFNYKNDYLMIETNYVYNHIADIFKKYDYKIDDIGYWENN